MNSFSNSSNPNPIGNCFACFSPSPNFCELVICRIASSIATFSNFLFCIILVIKGRVLFNNTQKPETLATFEYERKIIFITGFSTSFCYFVGNFIFVFVDEKYGSAANVLSNFLFREGGVFAITSVLSYMIVWVQLLERANFSTPRLWIFNVFTLSNIILYTIFNIAITIEFGNNLNGENIFLASQIITGGMAVFAITTIGYKLYIKVKKIQNVNANIKKAGARVILIVIADLLLFGTFIIFGFIQRTKQNYIFVYLLPNIFLYIAIYLSSIPNS